MPSTTARIIELLATRQNTLEARQDALERKVATQEQGKANERAAATRERAEREEAAEDAKREEGLAFLQSLPGFGRSRSPNYERDPGYSAAARRDAARNGH